MDYQLAKALHIIFVVTWFSGLFYIVRLFIYHVEAFEQAKETKEILCQQFKIMEKRLWFGITWPSAVLTLVFGSSLIHHYLPLSDHPWLMVKLFFVLGLMIYHFICGRIFIGLKSDSCGWSSQKLRAWNEVATLFLFAIVFLVVFKHSLSAGKAFAGLIAFSALLFMAIRFYKKIRLAKNS